MFFLLLYCTYCQITYDAYKYRTFSFYLLPLDVVKVNVPEKIGTFLGYMDEYDDLLFHVSSGDYLIESFDSNKGVAGIYFDQPYLLTFINEGNYEIKIDLLFMDKFPKEENQYSMFPITNLQLSKELEEYVDDHFIFYYDISGNKTAFYVMLVILILVNIFYFWLNSI